MTEFAAELDLLRHAVRLRLIGSEPDETLVPLLARVSWAQVLWLARQHGVLLHLHEMLRGPALAHVCPPEILAQLAVYREVLQVRSLARAREVCQLQDDFDRHAVRAILLDRWMAAVATHGRPDLVEIGLALPYVVSPHDRPGVEAMLTAAGRPIRQTVHTLVTIGRTPVLLNRGLGHHPSADRLLARAVRVEFGGRRLDALAPVHQLLPQVWRRTSTSDTPLRYHGEIAAIVRSVPVETWSELLPEAAHFGLDAAVRDAVTESHRTLNLPLPPTMVAAFAAHPFPTAPAPAIEPPRKPPISTAPFLPTPERVMARMLQLAAPGPEDVVYDLGCGDGRFVIQAAKDYGARGVGVDFDPKRIAEAKARATAHGVGDRVSFVCGDVFDTPLSEATVLCLYLLPSFFARILDRLRRDAKPGTRIVSHDYIFPGWPPEKTEIIRTAPLKVSQIYLWRLP